MDKEEKSKVGKGAKGRLVKQQSLPHDASTGSYFFYFNFFNRFLMECYATY